MSSTFRSRTGFMKSIWRRLRKKKKRKEKVSMAKKWRDLYGAIPAERRARIEASVAQDMAEMPLAEVRRARELTQQQIARNLEVNQAWVSKVERQMDMYVSTLRSYIEAMGGDLE